MHYVTLALVLIVVAFAVFRFARGLKKEVSAAHEQYVQRRAAEEQTLEVAKWIGQTGLDEETERELPRYLRREFGEFLDDPDGLKADDLVYLGVQHDQDGTAHFWRIPSRSQTEPCFAYVGIDTDGNAICLGWGDRTPVVAG
jgi:hypothetical protein